MFQFDQVPTVSGHVFRRDGKRGAVWYAKYRLPDGRHVQKRIGPAAAGPPTGPHQAQRARLVACRPPRGRGRHPARRRANRRDLRRRRGRVAALRREDRACKPTTLRDYRISVRSQFLPAFGERRLEDITLLERVRRHVAQMDAAERRAALENVDALERQLDVLRRELRREL